MGQHLSKKPKLEPIGDPRESMAQVMAFSARDWSLDPKDAWLYGIVCGWDHESLREVGQRHNWNWGTLDKLARLHRRFWER